MEKRDFRILVADDDDIARDVVGSLLSRDGYPVISAKNGNEAIRILTTDEIGLVITDLRMPGADGMEVLKYAVKTRPDAAVVILTAYGALDTTLEAMHEGAYDYLTKPFKGQEMLILAERAFRQAKLLREISVLRERIREIYVDEAFLGAVSSAQTNGTGPGWRGRLDRLASVGVFTSEEIERVMERLVPSDGQKIDTRG